MSVVETLDNFHRFAIRKKVHEFFWKNEPPSVDKILKSVNDDEDLPNFKRLTFHKVLKDLQFDF